MTNEELTAKFVELDERVTRHTEQLKTAYNRIDDLNSRLNDLKVLSDSLYKLITTVEILTREQKRLNEKLDKVSKDVEEIKNKPAKRWETIVERIITIVATSLITYLLAKIGLG